MSSSRTLTSQLASLRIMGRSPWSGRPKLVRPLVGCRMNSRPTRPKVSASPRALSESTGAMMAPRLEAMEPAPPLLMFSSMARFRRPNFSRCSGSM